MADMEEAIYTDIARRLANSDIKFHQYGSAIYTAKNESEDATNPGYISRDPVEVQRVNERSVRQLVLEKIEASPDLNNSDINQSENRDRNIDKLANAVIKICEKQCEIIQKAELKELKPHEDNKNPSDLEIKESNGKKSEWFAIYKNKDGEQVEFHVDDKGEICKIKYKGHYHAIEPTISKGVGLDNLGAEDFKKAYGIAVEKMQAEEAANEKQGRAARKEGDALAQGRWNLGDLTASSPEGSSLAREDGSFEQNPKGNPTNTKEKYI